MEIWNIYDVHRNDTGRKGIRGEGLEPGEFHLIVHVCIFNPRGEMLIQQRQAFKKGWPNLWDVTVGGSALEGETSQEAAQRELSEELGIQVELQATRPHMTINFPKGFDDVYVVEKDVALSALELQFAEVQDAKWASKETILQMIDAGEFIPYYKNFIQLLFEMREKVGGVIRVDLKLVGEEARESALKSLESTFMKLSNAYETMLEKDANITTVEKRKQAVEIGLASLNDVWTGSGFAFEQETLKSAIMTLESLLPSIETQIEKAKEGSGQKTLNVRRLEALQFALKSLENRLR